MQEKPLDCAKNVAENREQTLEEPCRQLEQAVFSFVTAFAALFVIDICDISITIVRKSEKAEVLIVCRICTYSYSQGCAVETLLTEDPEVIGLAFFRAMIDRLREFCVRKGLDYARGFGDDLQSS